jgi:hypothetical protein
MTAKAHFRRKIRRLENALAVALIAAAATALVAAGVWMLATVSTLPY